MVINTVIQEITYPVETLLNVLTFPAPEEHVRIGEELFSVILDAGSAININMREAAESEHGNRMPTGKNQP